jgi:protein SCO1/2
MRGAFAQDFPAPPTTMVPTSTNKPSILQNVGIDQKLGVMVPENLVFADEDGNEVQLGRYYHKRPLVLALVYYDCPMLCTMVLNDLLRTARAMPENIGTDYDILCVSFDPADRPELAKLKRETYVAQYNRPGSEAGWHFLTGPQASITKLTSLVGFRYAWDPKNNVFAHASGLIILSPDGKVTRYFYGIDYAPQDLRLALTEAAGGHVGSLTDEILLYCFHYDPATGKYGLAISRALKVGGVLTCLALGGFVMLMLRKDHGGSIRGSEQAHPPGGRT